MKEHSLEFPTRHLYGNPAAAVTVTEYGDFECPYCAGAAPILRQLIDGSQGRIRLVFRHFPLFEPHPYALTAALAAEAAGEQGAFWRMHDLLFTRQTRLRDSDLYAYGVELELKAELLVGDPAQENAPAVQADYAAGAEMGVHGTPTLFLNNEAYSGRLELGALNSAAARLMQQASRSL